jgi:hypothetical protein
VTTSFNRTNNENSIVKTISLVVQHNIHLSGVMYFIPTGLPLLANLAAQRLEDDSQ